MKLAGKTVTVVGLGKSGFAAAKFLVEQGARVRVTENFSKKEALEAATYLRELGAWVETGGHTPECLKESALVVVSPGVPKESMLLTLARERKIPIISEIELGSLFCRGPVIGVTGSNGKTTTCHLMHQMLLNAKKKSVLCGNVGTSFVSTLAQIGPVTPVVLELSSFQLEDSPTFRPKVAVVLNISPNHLDRHKTLTEYVAAKENIFRNQKAGDFLVLNYDDAHTRAMAKKTRSNVIFFSRGPIENGIYADEGFIYRAKGKARQKLMPARRFKLRGDHNLSNILACVAVGTALGLPAKAMQKTFETFETLEHRIEPIGLIRGVRFVNDSKSTTVDSTRAAIESVPGPLILLAGGRDKGAPFAELEPLLVSRVKRVVLYGEAKEKIAAAWSVFREVSLEKDLEAAARAALSGAKKGDTVLLSPMCTSFDQFMSYEHRGESFKKIVHSLRKGS
jgi:UDP-N-acetylmuramoylalanine--D-glutamate ligase